MCSVICLMRLLWGVGGKAFVCVVRTGPNLSFLFFNSSGSDEDVDKYLLIAAGFTIHDEAAQGGQREISPTYIAFFFPTTS